MVFVRSAALTHPGRRRPNNEDFVTLFEPVDEQELAKNGRIYILADGVGGASKGERASQYAAQKILYEYYRHPEIEPGARLRQIIPQVGNEIFEFAESQEVYMQMATTIVVAVIYNGTLQVAHVGDSRAYLIQNDQIVQLTRDHSPVGEMMRDGILTEEQAMHYEGRNPLSRSLGGHPNVVVDLTKPIPFNPGDKVLLVSDGFSRYATKQNIKDLLNQGPPDDVVYRLIDYANQKGGVDNISAILIEGISESEAVIQAPQGQTPEPVDWESIPTEPSLYRYQTVKRLKSAKKPSFVTVGIILILAIVVIVLSVVLNKIIKGGGELTIEEIIQASVAAGTPTSGAFVDKTQTPQEEVIQETLALIPAPVDTSTETIAPTEPSYPTETPTLEVNNDDLVTCLYTVRQSDIDNYGNLQQILLALFWDGDGEVFNNSSFTTYFFTIDPDDIHTINGDWHKEIPLWKVFEGDNLKLPDIQREDCINAGGEIIP